MCALPLIPGLEKAPLGGSRHRQRHFCRVLSRLRVTQGGKRGETDVEEVEGEKEGKEGKGGMVTTPLELPAVCIFFLLAEQAVFDLFARRVRLLPLYGVHYEVHVLYIV